MLFHRNIQRRLHRANQFPAWVLSLGLAVAVSMLSSAALAERADRTGSEVVTAVCARCHATGELGAPKIGDKKAWAPRAAQGLTALTTHALQGIRNMPAHGGNPALSDVEIERAITHMVNLSGGNWVEPIHGTTPAVGRTGEQIVQEHCSRCHREGLQGAPKIGDRAAWIQRLKNGLDPLVRSAVHGHGGMPARGGVADLSDAEIRSAIAYMFNFGIAMPAPPPPVAAKVADPYHKVIGGADVYLGILPARAMSEGQLKDDVPHGKDYYHLNISLRDAKTGRDITGAQVEIEVGDGIWSESKTLKAMSANQMVGYGGYFHMSGPNPYTINVTIRRPGVAGVSKARFEYRPG